jgi:hypothetical protein
MSQILPPPVRHGIAVVLIALVLLGLAAPLVNAGPVCVSASAVVPAFSLTDIVHDRSRLIQFSIVAVLLGIAMLWWGQKT